LPGAQKSSYGIADVLHVRDEVWFEG